MNFDDFFYEMFGLSGVGGKNSLRYFLWYDADYAMDWGYMLLVGNPSVMFTHVTWEKQPPPGFPRAVFKAVSYDSLATVYKYNGHMNSLGYGVQTAPSQDFWDKHGK
jgi:hypothetical protein